MKRKKKDASVFKFATVGNDNDKDFSGKKRNKSNVPNMMSRLSKKNIEQLTEISTTTMTDSSSTTTTSAQTESSTDNMSSTSSTNAEDGNTLYKRMMSFNVKWNTVLKIPKLLKRLHKSRLNMSQEEFSRFTTQLYQANCVMLKKKCEYMEPTTTNVFHDSLYVKMQRYLTFEQVIKLYIWKYFNETQSVPNQKLQRLLDRKLFHDDGTLVKTNDNSLPIVEKQEEENGKKQEEDDEEEMVEEEVEQGEIDCNAVVSLKNHDNFEDEFNFNIDDINEDITVEIKINEKGKKEKNRDHIVKKTSIKVNSNHTIQRVFWTVFQRNAVRNSRDYWLRGFSRQYPLLADLPFTEENNKVRLEFFLGLLKAKVSSRILCQICLATVAEKIESFEDANGLYDTAGENEEDYADIEIGTDMDALSILLENSEDTVLSKDKQISSIQRTSITNLDPVQRDIGACIKIQRFYRKRLRKLKDAVRIIEMWWEPKRRKMSYMRQLTQHQVDMLVVRANNGDFLQFSDYVEEIKTNYKDAISDIWFKRQQDDDDETGYASRSNKYWLEVVLIVISCAITSFVINMFTYDTIKSGQDAMTFLVIVYIILHALTIYRLKHAILWIQTICLLCIVSIFFASNDFSLYNISKGYSINSFRILILILLFRLCRRYWLISFIVLTIVIYITFFNILAQNVLNNVLYTIHDFYVLITVSGANRKGKPIQLVHKILTNYIFIVCILVSTIFGELLSRFGCLGATDNTMDIV